MAVAHEPGSGTRIVIAGGGFAGLYTALGLEKHLPKVSGLSVTLLNDENFFLFTPMLPEVAASSIGTRHIVSPLRKLLRLARFAEVTIEDIDLDRRIVLARHSLTGGSSEFKYDRLVLALGGVTNYFGIPGAEEHSIPFKTLGDAIFVRNHIIDRLEEAAVEPQRARELVSIVIVGGGLTGVEVAGALNDFVRSAARFYPEIEDGLIRITLVEALPRLLPEMNERLADFAKRVLIERGVEVLTQMRVERVTGDRIDLSGDATVDTRTVIWTAGVSPNPLLSKLRLPLDERGRIKVNEYLEVDGIEGVWALGDCANVPDPESERSQPPTAQHAVRQGKLAARNIVAAILDGSKRPLKYRTMGQMALVGERTGIADVMGYRFAGFFAWFLWRTYYLMRIPQLEKRLRVVMDWTLDLFFERDLVQLAVTRERQARLLVRPPGTH